MYSANTGDSRAILVTAEGEVLPLTKDQKPDDPTEISRITKCGGRVKPRKNPLNGEFIGPMRVWLADKESPGLAMSRSLGDYQAHTVGVTCEPVVTEYTLQQDDQIIVIGSDGIFEFLSNK